MAEGHKEPNYMAIFWWLLALTILEVIAAIIPINYGLKAALLVAFALAKALLVAMYFMHLRFETKTLGAIVLTPLVLCIFMLLMFFPDMLFSPYKHVGASTAVEKADTD
jgi:cytochrome c oxidase subunit 4